MVLCTLGGVVSGWEGQAQLMVNNRARNGTPLSRPRHLQHVIHCT